MKRKLLLISIIAMLLLVVGLVCACNPITGDVAVSAVTVETTEISLNTVEGNEYNTYQLYPIIYPDNASNKKVTFYFADVYDSEFLSISSTGLLTAKKEKKVDGVISTVEVMISSAENTAIKTSVFVTVENVAAEEIYFNPSTKVVNLATAPFYVDRKLRPAHASVGTDTTYSSTDTSVIIVDPRSGLVTPVGHGTARVVATAYSTATRNGYLEVVVRYAPPQYSLVVGDGDLNDFEQSPGEQKTIAFTLIPYGNSVVGASGLTLSDSNPKIEWSVAGKPVSADPETNGTAYSYTPEVNITAGVYTVTVKVTDADDQVLTLHSAPISIFKSLTAITLSSASDTSIIAGDLVSVTASYDENERQPKSYAWYAYNWTDADEAAATLYPSVAAYLATKTVPVSVADPGDFVYLTRTDTARLDYYPQNAGSYYFAAVPAVGTVDNAELFTILDKRFTVDPVDGTMISGLKFTYGYQNGTLMPQLKWERLGANEQYTVEAVLGTRRYVYYSGNGTNGSIGDTYYFYDNGNGYFTQNTFTFPSTFDVSADFTARVRTMGAYGWSPFVSYKAADYSALTALSKKYFNLLTGVTFDLFIEDPEELGELLNYFRNVMPNSAMTNGELTVGAATAEGFDHVYTVPLAIAYLPSRLGSTVESGGNLYEYLQINYADGTVDNSSYANIRTTIAANNTVDAYCMQGVKLSFTAYGDTGTMAFALKRRDGYLGAADSYVERDSSGYYYVDLILSLKNDDAINSTLADSDRVAALYPKNPTLDDATYYSVVNPLWSDYATDYDGYFAGVTATQTVVTSDQLYYVSTLGMKPLPTVGSAAETVYTAVKTVMNGIMKNGMTKIDKAIAIYDWLCRNVQYDHAIAAAADASKDDIAFHLEGVFSVGTPSGRRIAVCDGFAKAFALMCQMENIPCLKVSGESGGAGHAWNKFFINGKWYLADATWGGTTVSAGSEYINHDYLFATDSDFVANHNTYGKYPATAAVPDYMYYKTVGTYFTAGDLSDIVAFIRTKLTVTGVKTVLSIAVDPTALNGRYLVSGSASYLNALATALGSDYTLHASNYEPSTTVKTARIIVTAN